MRTLFRKPVILAFLSALVLTISPFNIPPLPKAHSAEVTAEIPKEVIMQEKIFTIERTPEASKKYAKVQMGYWGWEGSQWSCLEELWTNESNWRPNAYNETPVYQGGEKLHAGGIPQILGLDQSLDVEEQVARGFKYIKARYKSPCNALIFWNRHFSY